MEVQVFLYMTVTLVNITLRKKLSLKLPDVW